MSGNSNVNNDEAPRPERYEEGVENSHLPNDSKDERTIANRLANEERKLHQKEPEEPETAALKKDPTLPAKLHGNEPSKGAKIDASLQAEEEEYLQRKGKA
ncbi:hypothetical protein GGS24DRAFT_471894 [Hypoxylon argillaceum]|nr:hypothetical protein GGS24DRAFT_471894 [Hypoxylon argillaceum]KAI1154141.1 hypothetical protein F4825DRAFT_412718 [Nemania diffusa]